MTAVRARQVVFCFALASAVGLSNRAALAQQPSSNGDNDPESTPTVEAAYRDSEIKIDGRPDETGWNSAMPATEFVQGEPVENAPAEQETAVRVLYDERALYVSAVMLDWQPSLIGDQLVRRDEPPLRSRSPEPSPETGARRSGNPGNRIPT